MPVMYPVVMPLHTPGQVESKPAPWPLSLVQSLVNSVERPDGHDHLAEPHEAHAWLVDHDLLAPSAHLAGDDIELAVGVREGLRALLVANAGGPHPQSPDLAPLRDLAGAGQIRAHVDDGGNVHLVSEGDSVRDRMAGLLLVVRDAARDGSWARLKACANDECRWAFYDRSRNHGGTWCEMATCGNKLKNRDFRARRRASGGH